VIILGNIRQTHIKNTAKNLLKQHPEDFVPKDFNKNKEGVDKYLILKSKMLRNKVAGYITRLLANKSVE